VTPAPTNKLEDFTDVVLTAAQVRLFHRPHSAEARKQLRESADRLLETYGE